jgi:hypothetical protein
MCLVHHWAQCGEGTSVWCCSMQMYPRAAVRLFQLAGCYSSRFLAVGVVSVVVLGPKGAVHASSRLVHSLLSPPDRFHTMQSTHADAIPAQACSCIAAMKSTVRLTRLTQPIKPLAGQRKWHRDTER